MSTLMIHIVLLQTGNNNTCHSDSLYIFQHNLLPYDIEIEITI
jgi:hypothetical protein